MFPQSYCRSDQQRNPIAHQLHNTSLADTPTVLNSAAVALRRSHCSLQSVSCYQQGNTSCVMCTPVLHPGRRFQPDRSSLRQRSAASQHIYTHTLVHARFLTAHTHLLRKVSCTAMTAAALYCTGPQRTHSAHHQHNNNLPHKQPDHSDAAHLL